MYKCDKHGVLETSWCPECNETKECDCSTLTVTRFKDLILDCKDGERTFTIRVEHCDICGYITGILGA